MYVPVPAKSPDGFAYKLGISLDKALNLSMGISESKVQHLFKVRLLIIGEYIT